MKFFPSKLTMLSPKVIDNLTKTVMPGIRNHLLSCWSDLSSNLNRIPIDMLIWKGRI